MASLIRRVGVLLGLVLACGCPGGLGAAPAAPGLTVRPTTARLGPDGTVAFTAQADAPGARVTWTVQETGGGSVDAGGVYRAPVTPGTYHVVATDARDPWKTGIATVTVVPPSSIAIAPSRPRVAPGGTLRFTVDPPVDVEWSVARVGDGPPSAPSPPAFPLRPSSNGHHLVDQQDRPFRIQAEAAWFLPAVATPSMVRAYLDDRRAKGFNSIYVMAMVHPGGWEFLPNAPANHAGEPPFSTPGLFSTAGASAASERYWSHLDDIIDQAARRGMVVMLAFTYLGHRGGKQGWWQELLAQPDRQACFDWGAWLGRRYRTRTNVIWFACGDHTPPAGSEGEARVVETIRGIRSAGGASTLFMAELSPPRSVPGLDSAAIGPLIDIQSFYGYGRAGTGNSVVTANRAYHHVPAGPAFVQEPGYEGENNTGHFPGDTAYGTRRSRFWSVLAGGVAGDGFGTLNISSNGGAFSPWPTCLSSPGAHFSSLAFRLFASLPWWDLVPSGGANDATTAITWGGGTFSEDDDRYIASAVTSDRTWLLAYVPGTSGGSASRSFTVDMAVLGGPARARWWNPVTGTFTRIGTFANLGERGFTTPGSNGQGDDWLLVLDVPGARSCGRIDASGLYQAPDAVPPGTRCEIAATTRGYPRAEASVTVDFP